MPIPHALPLTISLQQQRIFNKALDEAGHRSDRYRAKELAPPNGFLVCLTRVGVPMSVVENALRIAEIWWCEPCTRLGVLQYAVEVRKFSSDPGEENVEWGLCEACAKP